MRARIDPAGSQTREARTNMPGRAARGMLILALMAGGLGAGTAATSGHGPGHQVSAHHAAGNAGLGARAQLARSGHAISNPWMY